MESETLKQCTITFGNAFLFMAKTALKYNEIKSAKYATKYLEVLLNGYETLTQESQS